MIFSNYDNTHDDDHDDFTSLSKMEAELARAKKEREMKLLAQQEKAQNNAGKEMIDDGSGDDDDVI